MKALFFLLCAGVTFGYTTLFGTVYSETSFFCGILDTDRLSADSYGADQKYDDPFPIVCFGDDLNGVVTDSSPSSQAEFHNSDIVQIAAIVGAQVCGLKSSGRFTCLGLTGFTKSAALASINDEYPPLRAIARNFFGVCGVELGTNLFRCRSDSPQRWWGLPSYLPANQNQMGSVEIKQLVASWHAFCALLFDGTIKCVSSIETHPILQDVPTSGETFDSISASNVDVCARVASPPSKAGSIICWGEHGPREFPRDLTEYTRSPACGLTPSTLGYPSNGFVGPLGSGGWFGYFAGWEKATGRFGSVSWSDVSPTIAYTNSFLDPTCPAPVLNDFYKAMDFGGYAFAYVSLAHDGTLRHSCTDTNFEANYQIRLLQGASGGYDPTYFRLNPEINPCDVYPYCENSGTCQYSGGVVSCQCGNFVGYWCQDVCTENAHCLNGGACIDGACDCTATGAEGTHCETLTDPCAVDPCGNGAACTEDASAAQGFVCHCTEGYEGDLCADDIDECAAAGFCNGGSCTNSVGGFSCDCADTGYEGLQCETDIDECQTDDPCVNGACANTIGDYTCACETSDYGYTWTGKDCDTGNACLVSSCVHATACNLDSGAAGGYTCDCEEGWEGKDCDQDINECLSDPCKHGDNCVNSPGSYQCLCYDRTIWYGEDCGLVCRDDLCNGRGSCKCLTRDGSGNCLTVDTSKCDCFDPLNYKGDQCEIATVNECVHGTWDPTEGSCKCNDPQRFNGPMCDQSCSDLCHGKGQCTCLEEKSGVCVSSSTTACECWNPSAWFGETCATPKCSGNGYFSADKCVCHPGFEGEDCSDALLCDHGEWASATAGGYLCKCEPGWTGEACTMLGADSCGDHGTWDDADSACVCMDGYTGAACDVAPPFLCVNGVETGSSPPICVCDNEWTGAACDVQKCVHGDLQFFLGIEMCLCDEDYFGTRCENNIYGYCSSNGVYSAALSKCECFSDFKGEFCEQKKIRDAVLDGLRTLYFALRNIAGWDAYWSAQVAACQGVCYPWTLIIEDVGRRRALTAKEAPEATFYLSDDQIPAGHEVFLRSVDGGEDCPAGTFDRDTGVAVAPLCGAGRFTIGSAVPKAVVVDPSSASEGAAEEESSDTSIVDFTGAAGARFLSLVLVSALSILLVHLL